MNIKKLILKSFGKFQNTTIDLKPGVNMIMGENEAGKSTIHGFVEGMFYGFYKQNIKNKKNSEAYDHFLPWDNANEFSGSLILEDNREVRIERSFMKTKDEVHVYDNVTGENIEHTYAYDSVAKNYQPGLKHFGMSQVAYSNTVSIGQMKSKTTVELSNEIRDKVINLGETKRVDVSLSNVLRKISEKKSAIGTERSKKSAMGKIKESISQMEVEKEDSKKVWEDIEALREREKLLKGHLAELEERKQDIEKQMNYYRINEDKSTFFKVKAIKTRLRLIDMELSQLDKYRDVSKDEIEQAIQKLNNIEFLKRENENQKEKVEELSSRIQVMDNEINEIDSIIVDIGLSEKISRDVYKYDEFENSKKYAGQSIEGDDPEHLKTRLKKAKLGKLLNMVLMVSFIVVLVFMVLTKGLELFGFQIFGNEVIGIKMDPIYTSLETFSLYTYIGLGVAFLLVLLFSTLLSGSKKSIKRLNIKINQAISDGLLFENRIKDIIERQNQLLMKYECTNYEEFLALKERKIKEELLFEENYKRARKMEEEKEELKQKYNFERNKYMEQGRRIDEYSSEVELTMSSLSAYNEEELRKALGRKEKYKSLTQEKENNLYLLQEITVGKSYLLDEEFGLDFEDNHEDDGQYEGTEEFNLQNYQEVQHDQENIALMYDGQDVSETNTTTNSTTSGSFDYNAMYNTISFSEGAEDDHSKEEYQSEGYQSEADQSLGNVSQEEDQAEEYQLEEYQVQEGQVHEDQVHEDPSQTEMYQSEIDSSEDYPVQIVQAEGDLSEDQLDGYLQNDDQPENLLSYDEFEEQLRLINNEILDDNKEISKIMTEIVVRESRQKKPVLIEEELQKNYEELEKMNFKLSSLELIEEAVTEISENMQNNFAPQLNEKLSKIVAAVTDYKYTEIKVDASIGISVLDREVHKLVNVADLSLGTLDLIYFALRLSIAEIMSKGKKLPILLDDSFVQYDEHRFVKALEYLSNLERQVILFTCHRRELQMIKNINPDVNIINL